MEDQLWNVFCETGDPMGYLLYRAKKKEKSAGAEQAKPAPPAGSPPASA